MNINSSKFNLSFQKKLMAKANVIKNNEPCPVSIYKLDRKQDKDYIKNLRENDSDWSYAYYLTDMEEQFEQAKYARLINGENLKFYTLEDENQKCLGLVEVDNGSIGKQNIVYFERFPANKEKKEFKYIGETLLAFLTKQQKTANIPRKIIIKDAMDDAQPFYTKSNFLFRYELNPLFVPLPVFDSDDENGFARRLNQMILPKNKMDLLLENNKNHTKSEIELVG